MEFLRRADPHEGPSRAGRVGPHAPHRPSLPPSQEAGEASFHFRRLDWPDRGRFGHSRQAGPGAGAQESLVVCGTPGRETPGPLCGKFDPWNSRRRWFGAGRKMPGLRGGCRCPWGSPLPQESWDFSPSWLWPVTALKRPGSPSGSLTVGAGGAPALGRACGLSPSTARMRTGWEPHPQSTGPPQGPSPPSC